MPMEFGEPTSDAKLALVPSEVAIKICIIKLYIYNLTIHDKHQDMGIIVAVKQDREKK